MLLSSGSTSAGGCSSNSGTPESERPLPDGLVEWVSTTDEAPTHSLWRYDENLDWKGIGTDHGH
jgi:hypothetical protein